MMDNRYTTLDQLEAAVKAMREAEAREGVKIDFVQILPMRLKTGEPLLGPRAGLVDASSNDIPRIDGGEDYEQAMIARVAVDGEMKMLATCWHPRRLGGSYWAKYADEYFGAGLVMEANPLPVQGC